MNVTGTSAGVKNNTTGNVTSTEGGIGNTASATLTVAAPPAVTTSAASGISRAGATLNGSVNPNGLPTDAWFEWGTDPTLASFTPTPRQQIGSGSGPVAIGASISGLTPGVTYYFRPVASNGLGGHHDGRRVSPEAIGAVSLGSILFVTVACFGGGLLLGLDRLVPQAFGAGQLEDSIALCSAAST